jgi:glycolate oxidase
VDLGTLETALREFLPDDALITQNEALRVYESDGLTAYRRRPGMVLLPRNVDEVARIVKLCHRNGVPIVARGAGTGLSGGALPIESGIVLSLARFNRIIEIDADNRLARVQPGVTNLSISEAAAPFGLYYAPDPSSQIACTIGGNVAENSGGVHCLKYGLTVHNILAVDIVTAEGEQVRIGATALDSCGFDLLALITGSEGMLGIITEVTVKLLPRPVCMKVVMAAFDSVEAAGDAVSAVIAAGIVPAGLEMMDALALRAAEDFVHAGYPTDARAILLCEVDGIEREVERQIAEVETIMTEAGATSLATSRDDAERERLWRGRKAAFPAVGRIAPDYYCMDGTIPRHQLGRVLVAISALSEEFELPVANVFHAGDGNLHPLILYDANRPGELARAEEMGARILELCVRAGGTITGEHGVGVEKIDQMCVQFHDDELDQFHRLKHAFDPAGILNPGKAVPTLRRCAEFGAMHVHAGQLPFPELERF